ncbi:MAG: Bax inhibitor-1/YccA family protein, partial [Bacteroidaceae bacterium]
MWVLIIAEFAVVVTLSSAINKLSFPVAGLLFVVYSVLNGLTLSVIFLLFTMSSIASTFFITAGTFAAMSFVGFITRKDLSGLGKILVMGLIGIVIATVVNFFVGSTGLQTIVNYLGVFIFVGLTAYDTQKIKLMFQQAGGEVNAVTQKMALMGSLALYLDFINLFLFLLRIFGDRR